jgi:hypothetical protein
MGFAIRLPKFWLDEHFQISISDKERTLIDAFIYPKMLAAWGKHCAASAGLCNVTQNC